MVADLLLSLRLGRVLAEPVPEPVISAVESVQVTEGVGQPNGFSITLTTGIGSLVGDLLRQGAFDPPSRVQVVITVRGDSIVLMDGVVTQHSLAPSSRPGAGRLTLTGEDVGRMMDLIDFSGLPFPAMPYEARVAAICAKYPMYGLVPVVVPSVFVDTPNPLESIPHQTGTDLEYVRAMAAQVGHQFFITPGPVAGVNMACWVPLTKLGARQSPLVINGDAATNVDSLSFTFDGFNATQYVVLIQEPKTKFPIPIPVPSVTPLNPQLGARQPIPLKVAPIRGLAKATPWQAAAIALARAADGYDVISAQGALDVLRYGRPLRARSLVEVHGAGLDYDGDYYVKSVTHDLKPGSYHQQFALTRNAFEPSDPFSALPTTTGGLR